MVTRPLGSFCLVSRRGHRLRNDLLRLPIEDDHVAPDRFSGLVETDSAEIRLIRFAGETDLWRLKQCFDRAHEALVPRDKSEAWRS